MYFCSSVSKYFFQTFLSVFFFPQISYLTIKSRQIRLIIKTRRKGVLQAFSFFSTILIFFLRSFSSLETHLVGSPLKLWVWTSPKFCCFYLNFHFIFMEKHHRSIPCFSVVTFSYINMQEY